MLYLLALLIILIVCTDYTMHAALRAPTDDFGAGVFAWLFLIATILVAVIYLSLVVFYHRFI